MRKLRPWQSNIVERAELPACDVVWCPFRLIAGRKTGCSKSRTSRRTQPAGKRSGRGHDPLVEYNLN